MLSWNGISQIYKKCFEDFLDGFSLTLTLKWPFMLTKSYFIFPHPIGILYFLELKSWNLDFTTYHRYHRYGETRKE